MGSHGVDYADSKPVVPHALLLTPGLQGHVGPMYHVAKQLCRNGFIVTFVSTEEAISSLKKSAKVGDGPSSGMESLDLRFVSLHMPEGDGQGVASIGSRLREAFEPEMVKLVRDKSAGIGGPTCIISDAFLAWTQDLADKLEIPRYMLVASNVMFARALQGWLPYFETGQFQISETDGKLVPFDWSVHIAGIPSLSYHELPAAFPREPAAIRSICESVGLAAGVLVNSIFELEEQVLDTWRTVGHPGFEHLKMPKVYPIGPLFSTEAEPITRGLGDSASQCLRWLDSQPFSSVL